MFVVRKGLVLIMLNTAYHIIAAAYTVFVSVVVVVVFFKL